MMTSKAVLFFIAMSAFFSAFTKEIILETLYGKIPVKDELILDLLESDAIQRMKHVDQSGITHYYGHVPAFSRYDHSIGVYHLTKMFSNSSNEQAAALLHDVSHTVFSHLGDMIFDHDDTENLDSYQDSIHYWFLNKANIKSILQKHNLTIMDIMHKRPEFNALEQSLPDVCIDRLEYNLHTGYICNLITKDDIKTILSDIVFDGERWYFKTPKIAKKFASLSLYFTENIWGSGWHLGIYRIAAQAFKRALNLKLLNFDEMHFSTDNKVLAKLKEKQDPSIDLLFKKCADYKQHISKGSLQDHNFHIKPKFRGINPWIKIDDGFYRLTAVDHEFAKEYIRVKTLMQAGHYLKLDIDI